MATEKKRGNRETKKPKKPVHKTNAAAPSNKGTVAVLLDNGATGTALNVSGTASFGAESKLALKLTSIENAEGNHVVLTAVLSKGSPSASPHAA